MNVSIRENKNLLPPEVEEDDFPFRSPGSDCVEKSSILRSPVTPRSPQEKEATFSEVGRVCPGNHDVRRPQRKGQQPGVGMPCGPVLFTHSLLVGVYGIQASQHHEETQVAQGAMELLRR